MEKFYLKTLKILLLFLILFIIISSKNMIFAASTSGLKKGDKIKFKATSWCVYNTEAKAKKANGNDAVAYLKNGQVVTIQQISGEVLKIGSNRYIKYGGARYFEKVSTSTSSSKTTSSTSKNKTKYTLTYNPNRGSGAPAKVTVESGKSTTISSKKPTRSGYTFLGWSKSSSASSASYKSGGSIKITSNTTLYAVWKKNTGTTTTTTTTAKNEYRVYFNKNTNDSVGNMPSSISVKGTTNKKLPTNKPTRNGYTFLGWSKSSSASSASYQPGSTLKVDKTMTLYAVWAKATNATSVSLNKTSITLEKGKSETLTATVKPSNSSNKSITWTSSNTSVATVSGGKVTAKKAGTATITAKTSNGKTATCKVTVKEASSGDAATMRKIAEKARTKTKSGECLAWVEGVYYDVTGVKISVGSGKGAKHVASVYHLTKHTDWNNIGDGAVVIGTGGYADETYGHCGIYNKQTGMVYNSNSSETAVTLQRFKDKYSPCYYVYLPIK